MSLKPIRRGYSDPFEVPYKCPQCSFFCKQGKEYPKCERREDGKLIPEPDWRCFDRKMKEETK